MSDIIKGARQKPLKAAAIASVLLFWMLAPLVAQRYFSYSAINISFVITVAYFLVWKLYENRGKFLDR